LSLWQCDALARHAHFVSAGANGHRRASTASSRESAATFISRRRHLDPRLAAGRLHSNGRGARVTAIFSVATPHRSLSVPDMLANPGSGISALTGYGVAWNRVERMSPTTPTIVRCRTAHLKHPRITSSWSTARPTSGPRQCGLVFPTTLAQRRCETRVHLSHGCVTRLGTTQVCETSFITVGPAQARSWHGRRIREHELLERNSEARQRCRPKIRFRLAQLSRCATAPRPSRGPCP
jgi:hypothetical protein